MTKPNILLIMADQLAPQALSFYGNPVCKTPNLDKLASTMLKNDEKADKLKSKKMKGDFLKNF